MDLKLPTWDEMYHVMPEVWLTLGMCAVVLVPFINRRSHLWPTCTAIVTLSLALWATVSTIKAGDLAGRPVFDGMLAIDAFSQFFKVLLLLFTLFIVAQWTFTSRHETSVYDVPDFLCLLLGAALGMALMASASNLLMIFIAMETASLPSFALAGFRKRHRVGSEGSLKYVVFGAASSAIMIYGMSLVYGATGRLDLAGIASAANLDFSPMLAVGLLAMFAGIAFKLSAVPLHFWCPDVFQGAAIEVTTFLSVASKGAAVVLLVRILYVFAAVLGPEDSGFTGVAVGVAVLGAITATWGNLLAYHQTNIKRLLAYSSIAHAGYMIMAASVMTLIRTRSNIEAGNTVAGAILFYLLIYMFMNLGAFTVAALVASPRAGGSEDIRDYAGLISRSPLVAVVMTLFLLSLFGMPGLGGFWAKVFLMKAMADSAGGAGLALIAVLLFNTLISLYYYLRPVYYMVLITDEQKRPSFAPGTAALAILMVCGAVVLWTGVLPGAAVRVTYDHGRLTAAMPIVLDDTDAVPDADAATAAADAHLSRSISGAVPAEEATP